VDKSVCLKMVRLFSDRFVCVCFSCFVFVYEMCLVCEYVVCALPVCSLSLCIVCKFVYICVCLCGVWTCGFCICM